MNKNRKIIILTLLALVVFVAVLNFAGARRLAAVDTGGNTISPIPASGSADTTTMALKKSDDGSIIWTLVKLVGALILVIAGIYGFLYLLRKMMGSRLSSNRSHRMIEVLETSFIAQKKSVSLVRFAERAVLIGITDNTMTSLAELSSDETAKLISEIKNERTGAGFKGILNSAREKYRTLNFGGTKTIDS